MHCTSVQHSNITSPLVKILKYSAVVDKSWLNLLKRFITSIFDKQKETSPFSLTERMSCPFKVGSPDVDTTEVIFFSVIEKPLLLKNLCNRVCLILIIECHAKKKLRNSGSNLRFFFRYSLYSFFLKLQMYCITTHKTIELNLSTLWLYLFHSCMNIYV